MNGLIEDIKMELSILKIGNNLQDEEISFYIRQEQQKILNITNLEEVPTQLSYVIVKRAVGNILNSLASSKTLTVNNEVIQDSQISSITRGDVSITYKSTSTSDTFKELITSYTDYGEKEILRFRVIKW